MPGHILQQDSISLQSLLNNVKQLQKIQKTFISLLPAKLALHCQVAGISAQQLMVMISSAAWLTALNFERNQLLEKFKLYPELAEIKEIKYKIMPELNILRKTTSRKMHKLSAATAAEIEEIAREIKDEKLRLTLQRIAKNKS